MGKIVYDVFDQCFSGTSYKDEGVSLSGKMAVSGTCQLNLKYLSKFIKLTWDFLRLKDFVRLGIFPKPEGRLLRPKHIHL